MIRINTLNENTTGFRFNIAGVQGLYRKRDVRKARALNGKFMGVTRGDSMTAFTLASVACILKAVTIVVLCTIWLDNSHNLLSLAMTKHLDMC